MVAVAHARGEVVVQAWGVVNLEPSEVILIIYYLTFVNDI